MSRIPLQKRDEQIAEFLQAEADEHTAKAAAYTNASIYRLKAALLAKNFQDAADRFRELAERRWQGE